MPSSNIAVSHADTGLVTAEVIRAERISPHFVRVTLGGEQLSEWRDLGFDQWFRLALPISGETRFDRLGDRFDIKGYLHYLALPKSTRPVIRNYTVREYRAANGSGGAELDIDFVTHGGDDGTSGDADHGADGGAGIAGPWAASLPLGAPVALIDQGCGYRAVAGADRVLLAGDESALPAVLGILRDLPAASSGTAIIEVPHADDAQPVAAPGGVEVRWLVRETGERPGRAALEELRGIDPGGIDPDGAPLSAFIAGEQQLASGGRRYLVNERGVPRANVDFSGYWRRR